MYVNVFVSHTSTQNLLLVCTSCISPVLNGVCTGTYTYIALMHSALVYPMGFNSCSLHFPNSRTEDPQIVVIKAKYIFIMTVPE
jgi:hypothetical protein